MQRFLSLLLFITISIWSYGQARMPIHTSIGIGSASTSPIRFVAKVNTDFDPNSVARVGGVIGSTVGDVMTLELTASQARELKNTTGLLYLQRAHSITPNLKRVNTDLRADSVTSGTGLTAAYTGKNVIIGVTDWGFDYTHPMFYDTALQKTRIVAAWDQFKKSGPAPAGYTYGTVYQGESELLAAQSDTANIYQRSYHGTHVAGIAGGGGAGTEHRGVAFESEFIFATFLVDEASVIDAFVWMRDEAEKRNKRLVINMSWGLYNLGPLDGSSLVSQAIDQLSSEGVVFVTSGGNNGDVDFHIKKTFNQDTVRSHIGFWRGTNPNLYGQRITTWGEESQDFELGIEVYDAAKNRLVSSPLYYTSGIYFKDTFLTVASDTIYYIVEVEKNHPLNNKPTISLRVKNDHQSLHTALVSTAKSGTVHYYNVTELTIGVGNWGMPLTAWKLGWIAGDNKYGLGEPASTRSVITVAAHQSEIRIDGAVRGGGFIADFSSIGPTIDERMKPDISAPGVSVMSSVSSFTDAVFSIDESVMFEGKIYPFSRSSGTSMSSPATAGVVALMLEANPFLQATDVKEVLQSTARQDARTGSIPSEGSTQWGMGKVDAYAAVKLSEQKALGVSEVYKEHQEGVAFPNPAQNILYLKSNVLLEVNIYSMDGLLLLTGEISDKLGLDMSELPFGVYILKCIDLTIAPQRVVIQR